MKRERGPKDLSGEFPTASAERTRGAEGSGRRTNDSFLPTVGARTSQRDFAARTAPAQLADRKLQASVGLVYFGGEGRGRAST